MTTREVLLAAANLVERGWTQLRSARGRRGEWVKSRDPAAAYWCAFGAIERVDPTGDACAGRALRRHLGVDSILRWNDAPERTQAEVVAALRGAAETA